MTTQVRPHARGKRLTREEATAHRHQHGQDAGAVAAALTPY